MQRWIALRRLAKSVNSYFSIIQDPRVVKKTRHEPVQGINEAASHVRLTIGVVRSQQSRRPIPGLGRHLRVLSGHAGIRVAQKLRFRDFASLSGIGQ